MPSFSKTLEDAIHAALAIANSRRHELATLEHLLLALVDELATNPFLRAGLAEVKTALNMTGESDATVFGEIRRRKDSF